MRLLVLLVLLAFPATAAAADETIAELARPTPVDAWGGRIAYSAYDAATGRYALMLGPGDPAPVAPKRSAFDVDLGRGPNGHASAIYPRSGGLYVLDLVTGHERRILRGSASLPTISGTRVAYVRKNHVVVRGRGRIASPSKHGVPTALELSGRRLAFTWEDTPPDRTHDRIYLQRLGGRRTLVDEASSGLLSIVETMQPAFEGGAIYYAVARRAAAGNHFGRYDLATGKTRDVVSRGRILSAAFDRGRFTYLQTGFDEDGERRCQDDQGNPSPCTLKRTPPVF